MAVRQLKWTRSTSFIRGVDFIISYGKLQSISEAVASSALLHLSWKRLFESTTRPEISWWERVRGVFFGLMIIFANRNLSLIFDPITSSTLSSITEESAEINFQFWSQFVGTWQWSFFLAFHYFSFHEPQLCWMKRSRAALFVIHNRRVFWTQPLAMDPVWKCEMEEYHSIFRLHLWCPGSTIFATL